MERCYRLKTSRTRKRGEGKRKNKLLCIVLPLLILLAFRTRVSRLPFSRVSGAGPYRGGGDGVGQKEVFRLVGHA